jgi:hypothetical protein
VHIETWTASCFEFAHFTDNELATALTTNHPNCGDQSSDELTVAVGKQRRHQARMVQLAPSTKQTSLGRSTWPMRDRHLTEAEQDPNAPLPEIARCIEDAHRIAVRPAGRWILRGRPLNPT